MRYLPVLLGFIGLVGTMYQFVGSTRLLLIGHRTDGVVIRNEWSSGRKSVAYPIVRFRAEDGRDHTVRGSSGSSPAEYSRGESVSVCYDPNDPTKTYLGSYLGRLGGLLFSGALSAVFFWFGLRIVRRPASAATPAS